MRNFSAWLGVMFSIFSAQAVEVTIDSHAGMSDRESVMQSVGPGSADQVLSVGIDSGAGTQEIDAQIRRGGNHEGVVMRRGIRHSSSGSCTPSDQDRWNPNLGGCCNRLHECNEDRPDDDVAFCAPGQTGHGTSCWDKIIMCRHSCIPACADKTPANQDRWNPDRGGCCSGLAECTEDRPQDDDAFCAPGQPGHGTSCWDKIIMCRLACQNTRPNPSPAPVAAPSPTPTCTVKTPADQDRWNPDRGGCCSGLAECTEDRPQDDDAFCAPGQPGHGESCWDKVIMCRLACWKTPMPLPLSTPTPGPTVATPSPTPNSVATTLKGAAQARLRPIRVGTTHGRFMRYLLPKDCSWRDKEDIGTTRSDLAKLHFDSLTSENWCKMDTINPSQDTWNFQICDQHLDFAKKQMQGDFRYHALIWHSQAPSWLSALSANALENAMISHINKTMAHYGNTVDAWDVVNEAMPDNPGNTCDLRKQTDHPSNVWGGVRGSYVEMAFRAARQANPKAKLFYNDYGADTLNSKSNCIFNMVKDLKNKGMIDGIGFQMHVSLTNDNQWFESLTQNLRRFADLGLEIHLTELDIGGVTRTDQLQSQANQFGRIFQICLDQSMCKSITFWGMGDSDSWLRCTLGLNEKSLLFDYNYEPKPAFNSVLQALQRSSSETCTNTEDSYMEKNNIDCEDLGQWWAINRCNNAPEDLRDFWAGQKICQKRCFQLGAGYDGDVC